jgi:hypothetical protein
MGCRVCGYSRRSFAALVDEIGISTKSGHEITKVQEKDGSDGGVLSQDL